MEDFSGPLDLILSLLSKNKMEISDIKITLILEQYLAWMDQRKALDLEVASVFVSMAAHLVYIKTRMLLSVGDEEILSEMEQLMAALEERRRNEGFAKVKQVIPALSSRYATGQDYIPKLPEPLTVDKTYRYEHKPEDLTGAIRAVLAKTDNKLPPPMSAFEGIVGREPYPVTDKAGEILRKLLKAGVTGFRALFHGSRSRSEIVATFIAVLELCKARRISLAGTQEDCTVTCTDEAGTDKLEVTVDTY
ncbi:MAG: segregation/condensation protein A [Oscillospiraceae bacterium]|nr:segregation/condensation protein A [Oscillospiraceae bacterium]